MIQVDNVDIDILKAEWDILIILDGCRYDIFKSVYENLIHSKCELKKAKTFCSGTKEWMQNNFYNKDCSSIIYLDPIVMFNLFIPDDTFFKTVMVWKTNWDYEYGTIKPDEMTDVALEQIKQHPKKRFIIHYHQPHPPYLMKEYLGIGEIDTPDTIQNSIEDTGFNFSNFYQGCMRRFFGYSRTWKWLTMFGVDPCDYYGKIYKKYGQDGLVRGYRKNLELALYEINRLIDVCNGKIVVTSDHSHNLNGDLRGLKEQFVPWLEVT